MVFTTSMIKKVNVLEILNVVKKAGIISKPEIAKKTKLTNVTVNNFINALLIRNIVIEEGNPYSIGGRKAITYKFNDSAFYIVGVHIMIENIIIGLFDLSGRMIDRIICSKFSVNQSVEEVISLIVRDILKVINDSGKNIVDIIGIGVTVPGRVNYKEGIIRSLTNLPKWINIPIKEILERELKISTFIERDSNSQLSSLKWLNVTENLSNVAYLNISEGIGGSILIDGHVYHGSHGLAGEIGHTSVDISGARCNCGNKGCLEVFASYKTITQEFKRDFLLHEGDIDQADSNSNITFNELNIDDVIEYAKEGNASALRVFSKASRYVGMGILNIVNSYDPSMIIVECKWLKELRNYFNEVVNYVYENTKLINRRDVKIIINPIDDITALGSAIVVIEHIFSDIKHNKLIS